jgi:2,3-bisphosphoglycerate-independent phosphoglycerate mutase
MQELIKGLIQKNNSKIILMVMDGVGGLPQYGKTELEAASTPNLDALAREGATGLHVPVGYGITPGSGPGHLGLFGYDPIKCEIGRGILEALGLGLEVGRNDVAVRCNYSTIDNGIIKDRRAGRPPTEESRKLTERLQKEIPEIDGVKFTFGAGMGHRFAVIMSFPQPLAPGAAAINDSDPQKEGNPPLPLKGETEEARKVAAIATKFIERASKILKDQSKADYVLMRGFSTHPHMPSFEEAYQMRALAIAAYPMYRGLARLVEMHAPNVEGGFREEMDLLKSNYNDFDFFFIHFKETDSYGEDGNFQGKVKKIEEADSFIPEILSLNPDVFIVTGDHSTPSVMKGHSWHPVPVIIKNQYVLGGLSGGFSERECLKGELGIFPSRAIMSLALAGAGRLKKYGA